MTRLLTSVYNFDRRKITVLILFFACKFLAAQTDSSVTFKHQVKLSPVRMITDIRGLQLSYELGYCTRHSTQLTMAWIFDPFPNDYFLTWKKMNGYLAGIEQKYFLKQKEYSKSYFSADFVFLNCSFENSKMFGFKSPKDSAEYAHQHLDTVTVKRRTYTLCFRYGIQLYRKHFILDLNIGLGIRYRDVSHSGKFHPEDKMEMPRHPNIPYEISAEGKYFTPNIPLGLKIGYRF